MIIKTFLLYSYSMSKVNVAVLASGRGSNFLAILNEIKAGRCNAEIKVLITDNPEANAIEIARQNKISSIVRGLRPTGDFEIEFQMASMNRKINPDCDTVFLMTSEKLYYISSSLVKEVYLHDGDISSFVPPLVQDELSKIKKKG